MKEGKIGGIGGKKEMAKMRERGVYGTPCMMRYGTKVKEEEGL